MTTRVLIVNLGPDKDVEVHTRRPTPGLERTGVVESAGTVHPGGYKEMVVYDTQSLIIDERKTA